MRLANSRELDRIIGRNIRLLRKLREETQLNLATALGVSVQQVQKYESGIDRISAVRLFLASRFLGLPFELFFRGLSEVGPGVGIHPSRTSGPIKASAYCLSVSVVYVGHTWGEHVSHQN